MLTGGVHAAAGGGEVTVNDRNMTKKTLVLSRDTYHSHFDASAQRYDIYIIEKVSADVLVYLRIFDKNLDHLQGEVRVDVSEGLQVKASLRTSSAGTV